MLLMAVFAVSSARFHVNFINEMSVVTRFADSIPQKQYSVVKKIEEHRGPGRKPGMNKGIG